MKNTIPEKLDNLRRVIINKGYDHYEEITLDDLNNLIGLANKIRKIDKESE